MWNSPNIQIHPIVWEGREQGLDIYISRCETPIDLFLLFWLACTYYKNYVPCPTFMPSKWWKEKTQREG
jgi:hypothetical protein